MADQILLDKSCEHVNFDGGAQILSGVADYALDGSDDIVEDVDTNEFEDARFQQWFQHEDPEAVDIYEFEDVED